jgi:hypothetical protein
MGEKCIFIKEDKTRCKSWAVKGYDHCRKHLTEDEQIRLGIVQPESEEEEQQTEGLGESPESTEPKKEATKPWNADGNPWSLDLLKLNKKHPGFRCKWVNPDNIRTRQDQGWKIANIKDYGGTTDTVPGEEGKIDTVVKRREMILMEIPEELARERDKFYHHKTNRAMEAAQRNAEDSDEAKDIKRSGHDPMITSRFSTRRGGF